ncbi:MAG: hypothetical protein P4L45_13995 [Ignavibacteriaceae bacterium]|nr:hypothetical protein [Ignavibacteriaceae bacterium]
MDLIKQYIIQSLSAASNNLRLSTEKIEVVALLREVIVRSEDLPNDIKLMKKITELSTLAIRLNEIYNYLTQGQIDLFKLSDKFKEHSQFLIKDLSRMLDTVNSNNFKKALEKLNETREAESSAKEANEQKKESLSIDLSKRQPDESVFVKSETEIIKEKIILEEDKDEESLFIQNYESEILKPIKPIDTLLKDLLKNEYNPEDLWNYANLMKTNGELSAKIGFEIISNMHRILSKSLLLIRTRELMPGREVVEALRACLIVIVAVVKGKEVDITNYLNRAEEFGKKIQSIKIKDTI